MPGGLSVPQSVRATWPAGNFVHPDHQGPTAPIIISILAACAVVVVAARYWSRFRLQKNPGIDDWIFLAAMPGAIGLTVGVFLATTDLHSNIHIWDMKSAFVGPMRKLQLANYCCYVWSTCLIKVSVLAFYRRLTDAAISPRFVYILWATIALNILYFLVSIITVCFPCYPLRVYWEGYWQGLRFDQKHPGLDWHCLDEGNAVYYVSMAGLVLDLITTLLPFSLFLRLRMPSRQKIAMTFTFLGGFVVCGASAARTWTAHLVYFDTYDMTWNNYYFWLSTGIEVLVAVICASAPSLKFYFRRYLDVPDTRIDPASNNLSASGRAGLLSRFKRRTSMWSNSSHGSMYKDASAFISASGAPSAAAYSPIEAERGYFSVLSEKNGHGAASANVGGPQSPFHAAEQLEQEEWEALEGDILRNWHARTRSAQEDELRASGILREEVATPSLPVGEQHGVFYPWQEVEPVVVEEMAEVRL